MGDNYDLLPVEARVDQLLACLADLQHHEHLGVWDIYEHILATRMKDCEKEAISTRLLLAVALKRLIA